MLIDKQERLEIYFNFIYFFCNENEFIKNIKDKLLKNCVDNSLDLADYNGLYSIVREQCLLKFNLKSIKRDIPNILNHNDFLTEVDELLLETCLNGLNNNLILKSFEKFNKNIFDNNLNYNLKNNINVYSHLDLLYLWFYSIYYYMNPSLKVVEFTPLNFDHAWLISFLQFYLPSSAPTTSDNLITNTLLTTFKTTITENLTISINGLPEINDFRKYPIITDTIISELFNLIELPNINTRDYLEDYPEDNPEECSGDYKGDYKSEYPNITDDDLKFYSINLPATPKNKKIVEIPPNNLILKNLPPSPPQNSPQPPANFGAITLDDILFVSNKIDQITNMMRGGKNDPPINNGETCAENNKNLNNKTFTSKLNFNEAGNIKNNFMCIYDSTAFEQSADYHLKRQKLAEKLEKRHEIKNSINTKSKNDVKNSNIKQRSNKNIIKNALIYYVFAVKSSNSSIDEVLNILDNSDYSHFFILFSDRINFKLQFRGLYAYQNVRGNAFKLYGVGPTLISEEKVENVYIYENAAKMFKIVPHAKGLSIAFDAFSLKRTK